LGIPVLAGIYGTNPAGGGYQGISPTILFAHKDCNIAVGGGGILSGMSPKGYFDEDGAEALIEAAKQYKVKPPGSVEKSITTKPVFSICLRGRDRGFGRAEGLHEGHTGLRSEVFPCGRTQGTAFPSR
jgi:hypothetical protein